MSLLRSSSRLLVLTGAGCSTESGIPDYRDLNGDWKRVQPVQFGEFVKNPLARRRYWARSLLGWPAVAEASPNLAHRALARLEAAGHVHHVVTQNVDRLHQRAGSERVIDLHGRLDTVGCLGCAWSTTRKCVQLELERLNPAWSELTAESAPDGDANLDGMDFMSFRVPACPQCGGVLKPAVVFFGEAVPRERVTEAFARLEEADALLVVGSSLMVFSGYRFARWASEHGLPLALINIGRTRADDMADIKIEDGCGQVLTDIASELGNSGS